MDEVDSIIIHSLRTIGCDVDEEHASLSSFTAELIYLGVRCCLEAIRGNEVNAPRQLPPGMSQRFRAGSALASLVKEIGYSGEVGYQTFLYSNEADIRKVLMFLVDKLPRDAAGTADDTPGSTQQLRSAIAARFKEELKSVWLPHVCHQNKFSGQRFIGHELLSPSSRRPGPDLANYHNAYLQPMTRQAVNGLALCSALIENNSLQLVSSQNSQWRLHAPKSQKSKAEKLEEIKKELQEQKAANEAALQQCEQTETPETRFTQLEKLQHAQSEATSEVKAGVASEEQPTSEEEVRAQQEQEVEALKGEIQSISSRITKLNKNMEKAKAATEQAKVDIEEKTKMVEEQKKAYQVKKKTLDVLPEAHATMAKVQQLMDSSDSRMKSLEDQWRSHSAPLVQQIEDLKLKASTRQAEIELKLSELQDFKQEMKSSSEEAKTKDELLKSLTAEYQSMTKDASRSSYTKKIIEIVGNIKKQKRDIDKVLQDTKAVQKDINILSGKLDRTFTVTDELIFKDAKRDEGVRAAYKYLASLHDNCTSVRDTIEETGVILREIRQLEDQIDQESKKEAATNLEKITSDYQQIRRENQQLLKKLKG